MAINLRHYELHDFYCINCGNKGLPIARAGNKLKKEGHRKLIYCPSCRHTINHVECRNAYEVEEFVIAFKAGEYKKEAQDEILFESEHESFSTFCYGGVSRKR